MTEMFGKEYIVKVTNDGECVTMQEVIRCAECVNYRNDDQFGCGLCMKYNLYFGKDDYCGRAKRKDHD